MSTYVETATGSTFNVAGFALKPHHSPRPPLSSAGEISRQPTDLMDALDDLASIREDVERAIELFVQLKYFTLGSAAGGLDGGRSARVSVRNRSRRVFHNAKGQRLVSVLPGGSVEQTVTRTGRSGGFARPESERDEMLWKSTIGRKLGRLDEAERAALQDAARLRIANRALRGVLVETDSILGSGVESKRLTLQDVRRMVDETNDIVRVLGTPRDRSARGSAIEQAKQEQGYRRRIIEACASRRRSIVNSQVYANAFTMFAIICSPDRSTQAYCLYWSPD